MLTMKLTMPTTARTMILKVNQLIEALKVSAPTLIGASQVLAIFTACD
jgi:hypothetical protein